jgi:hypothetical protein
VTPTATTPSYAATRSSIFPQNAQPCPGPTPTATTLHRTRPGPTPRRGRDKGSRGEASRNSPLTGASSTKPAITGGGLEDTTQPRRTRQASLPHAYGLGEPACPEHSESATTAVHRTLARVRSRAPQTRRTSVSVRVTCPAGLSVLRRTLSTSTDTHEDPNDERPVLLGWADP